MMIRVFEQEIPKPYYWLGAFTPKHHTDMLLGARGKPPSPNTWTPDGTVKAYINHSRWVVDCPYCRNAVVASKDFRLFWCNECCMVRNQDKALEVVFPADVSVIEEILNLRPDPATRNWYAEETVAQLLQENRDHGHAIGVNK